VTAADYNGVSRKHIIAALEETQAAYAAYERRWRKLWATCIVGRKGMNVLELEDCEIQVHKNATKGSLIEVRPASGYFLLVRKDAGPLGGTFISTRKGKKQG